jgi:hypothetical protein
VKPVRLTGPRGTPARISSYHISKVQRRFLLMAQNRPAR